MNLRQIYLASRDLLLPECLTDAGRNPVAEK